MYLSHYSERQHKPTTATEKEVINSSSQTASTSITNEDTKDNEKPVPKIKRSPSVIARKRSSIISRKREDSLFWGFRDQGSKSIIMNINPDQIARERIKDHRVWMVIENNGIDDKSIICMLVV